MRTEKDQVASLCLLVYHFLAEPNLGLEGLFLQHFFFFFFFAQSAHPSAMEAILFTSHHLIDIVISRADGCTEADRNFLQLSVF